MKFITEVAIPGSLIGFMIACFWVFVEATYIAGQEITEERMKSLKVMIKNNKDPEFIYEVSKATEDGIITNGEFLKIEYVDKKVKNRESLREKLNE